MASGNTIWYWGWPELWNVVPSQEFCILLMHISSDQCDLLIWSRIPNEYVGASCALSGGIET